MKVFLDDRRRVDEKYQYTCVQTYSECVSLLQIFSEIYPEELEFIDLDYDLSQTDPNHSGLDVLVYMVEHGIKPLHINIHSSHDTGALKMLVYAEKHFSEMTITTNKSKL